MSGPAEHDGGERRGVSPALAPLGIALGYWLAATFALTLTRGGDGIATLWPASGVLLAGLLRLPPRRAWQCVGWTAVGSLAANLHAGTNLWLSAAFTFANMTEALIAVAVVARTGPRRLSFIDPRDVARFCLAATVAAGWSAGVAWLGAGRPQALFALSWFSTVMLGMLIVTPATLIGLALLDRDPDVLVAPLRPVSAVALLALVATVSAATFSQPAPLLFLPLVALLGATYRKGPVGAAAGVLIVAVIGSILTGMERGPIAASAGTGTYAVFLLQFYLLVSFAAALPLAALLAAQRRLATQCAASERMHRLLADRSSDIIARLTPDGAVRYVSPAAERVLGYAPTLVTGEPTRFVHPDDRARVRAAWVDVAENGEERRFTFRQRRRSGGHAWLEAACRPVMGEDGAREIVATVRDVTERHAAEAAAEEAGRRTREANRMLGMAERAAQLGHWRLALADRSVFWSPELFRIHGIPSDRPPPYEAALDCYHPDDRARVGAMVEAALASGSGFEAEARVMRPDGEVRHVVVRGLPEFDEAGVLVALFGVMQDVTRRVLVERELDQALRAAEAAAARAIRLADTDALTGVASRRKALAELDDAIAVATAHGEPLALAIFDIDHFKAVNDVHGHAAGDAVLRRVARAARQAVRPTDLVGRLGGEEFVVLLPGMGAELAVARAETLRRAIEASGDAADAGPPVTASVGVALLGADGSAAALLGEADRALYRAKASGRNAARLAA